MSVLAASSFGSSPSSSWHTGQLDAFLALVCMEEVVHVGEVFVWVDDTWRQGPDGEWGVDGDVRPLGVVFVLVENQVHVHLVGAKGW